MTNRSPENFIRALIGAPVTVCLDNGHLIDGTLESLDGCLNITLRNSFN